jgi:hypothetical protein
MAALDGEIINGWKGFISGADQLPFEYIEISMWSVKCFPKGTFSMFTSSILLWGEGVIRISIATELFFIFLAKKQKTKNTLLFYLNYDGKNNFIGGANYGLV